jgi:dTDP-4-amino-4,6-dideoxygalactose transaminase
MNPIPILDLAPQIDELWNDLNRAIQEVLRSGHFIMGEQVQLFEQEAAEYLNVKHAIAVNSGTDALVIALRALNIGAGDEVITTPFSFFATAECISNVGAMPVFADVEMGSYNLDVEAIEEKITSRTKAIIPVHLFGQPANMDAMMQLAHERGLAVLEDVAQAFGGEYRGRKLGGMGQMAAFSFFPTKNLGAYGDGGMITTNDDQLAQHARMLRVHGSGKNKYYNELIGYNSRLDTLQAAILRVKLPYVDRWNQQRQRNADLYDQLLKNIPGVVTPVRVPESTHVFHQYTVRILDGKRDQVHEALKAQGIQTMIYYVLPIHKLPVYAHLGVNAQNAERLSREVLSLPMYPELTPEQIQRVCDAIRTAL